MRSKIQENAVLRFLWKLDKTMRTSFKFIAGTMMGVLVTMVIIQVILRYFFRFSFRWVEELARYLSIYSALLGGALAYRYAELALVSFVVDRVPRLLREILAYVCHLLVLLFAAVMLVGSNKLIAMLVDYGQLSPAMQIPMYLAYASIPLCGIALAIFSVIQITFKAFGVEKETAVSSSGEEGGIST